MYIDACVYIYIDTCVYIYIYMYVYVYIYTNLASSAISPLFDSTLFNMGASRTWMKVAASKTLGYGMAMKSFPRIF